MIERTAVSLLLLGSLAPPVHAQCELDKLTASDAAAGASFGIAVAVGGDRALVGALDDERGHDAGAVYAFERAPTAWVQRQKLVPADVVAGDRFGAALARDGALALAGAPGSDAVGPNEGAAYVLVRSGEAWRPAQRLTPSDPGGHEGDAFGYALALSGTTLLVLAPFRDNDAGTMGAAYVFERVGSGWTETAALDPGLAPAVLGLRACALDGDVAVLGVPYFPFPAPSHGAAFVYERSQADWIPTQTLHASDGSPTSSDAFGASVAVDGDRILVGAPFASGLDGAAYVFVRGPTGWTEEAKLDPSGNPGNGFGIAVALEGDAALVGAPRSYAPQLPDEAFVFEHGASGWSQVAALAALDSPEAYDAHGAAVALAGDVALIGAYGDCDDGAGSGSAYVWSLSGTDCPSFFAVPDRLSLASGGVQIQSLRAGAEHAGELALVLGSRSGTAPGVPVNGLILPLNQDPYFLALLQNPNTLIAGSLGVLDAGGEALAQLVLPAGLDPSLAGVVLHHAYASFDVTATPAVAAFTSIAQPLELRP